MRSVAVRSLRSAGRAGGLYRAARAAPQPPRAARRPAPQPARAGIFGARARTTASAAAAGMMGAPTSVQESVRQILTDSLKPQSLEIVDESSKHANHAAMKGLNASETHFNLSIVSNKFEGLTAVKRHQLVYRALSEWLSPPGPVHALSMKLRTPAEAEQ